MSGPNADKSLPPGDRDGAPELPMLPPAPTGGFGLSLEMAQLNRLLTEGGRMFGEFRRAFDSGDLAVAEAKAYQLADLLSETKNLGALARVIAQGVTATRPKERRKAAAEKV